MVDEDGAGPSGTQHDDNDGDGVGDENYDLSKEDDEDSFMDSEDGDDD